MAAAVGRRRFAGSGPGLRCRNRRTAAGRTRPGAGARAEHLPLLGNAESAAGVVLTDDAALRVAPARAAAADIAAPDAGEGVGLAIDRRDAPGRAVGLGTPDALRIVAGHLFGHAGGDRPAGLPVFAPAGGGLARDARLGDSVCGIEPLRAEHGRIQALRAERQPWSGEGRQGRAGNEDEQGEAMAASV
ncbi:MAG: hypothetical protein EKK65_04985 [Lysobacterales bacterium]|nr:MAG: hypothetical protein EKK65_04985 [Xanthomonadales bacterium]